MRRILPGGGRIYLDRPLPFVVVHLLQPGQGEREAARLVTGQASYILLTPSDLADPRLDKLIGVLAEEMHRRHGAFLWLELWEGPWASPEARADSPRRPRFTFFHQAELRSIRDALAEALGTARLGSGQPRFGDVDDDRVLPASSRLFEGARPMQSIFTFGIEVEPFYRSPRDGHLYPMELLQLERVLNRALRVGLWQFTKRMTRGGPRHPDGVGKRSFDRATTDVEHHLERASERIEFLLLVTPVNAQAAWRTFQRDNYERAPELIYRPLPIDPEVTKRKLFNIPIEWVEDPTIADLFREQQEEMDRKVSMLLYRNQPPFLYHSLLVYPAPDAQLVDLAERLLARLPTEEVEEARRGGIDGPGMADRAREEIERYRFEHEGFDADVQLCDDIAAGIQVSKHRLLISTDAQFPEARVRPLLEHEVGTHLTTFFNGRRQRLRMFERGLAGYEVLQEGLAVLAEYLIGGLGPARLRTIAGRVVACDSMIRGATFVETFRRLVRAYGFRRRTAFRITLRIYRGGGLTKDALYLRGLMQVSDHLAGGGDIELLYLGKIALDHVPSVQELFHRQVVRPPVFLPRFLRDEAVQERLNALKRGKGVLDHV